MSTIRANTIVDTAGGNTVQINGITPALSSQAQAEAGTDNTTQMTPLRVRNALNATGSAPTYACRAWVNFNGTGTVAIRASGNVSSITDNGTGDYTVNFTTAMQDANYVVVALRSSDTNAFGVSVGTQAAGSVQINTRNTANAALTDASVVCVAILR
jgi:hypothetical protein